MERDSDTIGNTERLMTVSRWSLEAKEKDGRRETIDTAESAPQTRIPYTNYH